MNREKDACPSPSILAAYADGTLEDKEEHAAALDHIAHCAACRALSYTLGDIEDKEAEGAQKPIAGGWFALGIVLILAGAAIVLAVSDWGFGCIALGLCIAAFAIGGRES